MIYVDELRRHGGAWWCHMVTDGDMDELHAFARRMGLLGRWFQDHPRHPHYDLTPGMRIQAVRLGAKETTARALTLLEVEG